MRKSQTLSEVGIVAYGCSLPQRKISSQEIALGRQKSPDIPLSLGIHSKTFPQKDEDSITFAVAAGKQALERLTAANFAISELEALFVGSESHPYAVKPSGTVIQSALGLPETLALADLQFACKAGTQSMQIVAQYLRAGQITLGMAIGADTAQARPADVLEFTAAAGAAAYILGKEKILAKLIASVSLASDTPDFWRRPGQLYPQHAGRFTGEPAYFKHVSKATQMLLKKTELKPEDIDFCIFHTPNAKFPEQVASRLGFQPQQLAAALIVKEIGNTYAAASLLALAAVLDQAQAGQKILMTSYGSGSGADSFLFETTEELVQQRQNWSRLLSTQISALQSVNFLDFLQQTGTAL
ncbi:Hydroxymethylglutaryl-CoA synthase [bioreactor metagenome]|jgi:hydroxymethylglutaryl-CoA synthase|uniref:Hydroxymethylglutaryl-CoA synthase n=1 Tax=bioreactor metagenome TaxID=1076179 RepID=A0A645A3R0_9ZZZZ